MKLSMICLVLFGLAAAGNAETCSCTYSGFFSTVRFLPSPSRFLSRQIKNHYYTNPSCQYQIVPYEEPTNLSGTVIFRQVELDGWKEGRLTFRVPRGTCYSGSPMTSWTGYTYYDNPCLKRTDDTTYETTNYVAARHQGDDCVSAEP